MQALLALAEWLSAHGTAVSEETLGFLGGKNHLSTSLPKDDRVGVTQNFPDVIQLSLMESLDARDDNSHSRFFSKTKDHALVARLFVILHMLVLFMSGVPSCAE